MLPQLGFVTSPLFIIRATRISAIDEAPHVVWAFRLHNL
jgi:hypothetical protein